MNETAERVCVVCETAEEVKALERCKVCYRYFCYDCAHKSVGHRFCSHRCSLSYIYGDEGDDDKYDSSGD